MNQALASDVLEWLIEPSGECEQSKLFTWLNQCRERMYQFYDDIPLFEIIECFEVQSFCVDCNACGESYRGVTLPRDHQTVEALWVGDTPIVLHSSWREWQRGIATECVSGLAKYDMPGLFSTERELNPLRPARLGVSALHPDDVGKKVALRGRESIGGGGVLRELTLQLEPQFTDHPFVSLSGGAGFTKTRTVGAVMLKEENGRVLSIHGPDETIPGYRRIKIAGLRDGAMQVNLRSSRRYFPVFRENDVVETDNRTAFEELTRFLRLNKKQNKDGNDIRAAAVHFGQARAALLGDKARDIGKSTTMEMRVESIGYGPRRLGGW